MNIITLTLNPAIDVHLYCEHLRLGEDNPYVLKRRDSGGKGVNVSRALHANGQESVCFVALGEENAEAYLAPLYALGMNIVSKSVKGRVRENINIHTADGDTVLAGEGACVDICALSDIKNAVLPLICEGTYICFCGRIPPSSDKEEIIKVLKEFKEKGARLILDSRSFDCSELAAIHPYLIKPNREELCELMGYERVEKEGIMASAIRLSREISDSVLLTLGKDGAIYASGEGTYRIYAPDVLSVSTTGAGDSSIAGLLSAIYRGSPVSEMLTEAIAFGSAACMTEGTLPPKPSDIAELREKVRVEKL